MLGVLTSITDLLFVFIDAGFVGNNGGIVLMTEKAFENKVKEYLKQQNCWVLKTWSNGVQRSGIPDLLVCCNGFFLGIELKAKNGRPSELQLYNVRKIRESGGFAVVLYPHQFSMFQTAISLLKANSLELIDQTKFDKEGWF